MAKLKKAKPKKLSKKKRILKSAKMKVRTKMTMRLEELEAIYMDGNADYVSGDVEAPTGHFYLVDSQIVTTDSQGFCNVETFLSGAHAKAEFDARQKEYIEWADD